MIIMLVMSLMGVGLVQSSVKSTDTAAYKTVDAEVFHLAESCVQEQLSWLGSQTRPPDDSTPLPYSITRNNLSGWNTGQETAAMLAKLAGYQYETCTVTDINNKSVSGDTTGQGADIGMAGGYGASGDISPRYYYQISATAKYTATTTTRKKIVAIVSLEF